MTHLSIHRWLLLMIMSFCVPTASAQQPQLTMAITFDDLPAHGQKPPDISRLQIIQSLLHTFEQQKLPPMYGFLNGVRTEEDPTTLAVLQAWRAAGQSLGNHTWAHPDLETTDPDTFIAEIEANQPLLRTLMPHDDWRWFRYPFLHEGETLEKHRAIRAWLSAHHYQVAEISMDFEDYLWNAPYTRCTAKRDTAALQQLHDTFLATAAEYIDVYRTLSKELYNRDIPYILLMHTGAFEARMLPELLNLYRTRGFTFITLTKATKDPAYAEDPDTAYPGGGALTEQLAAKHNLEFPKNSKPYKQLDSLCR